MRSNRLTVSDRRPGKTRIGSEISPRPRAGRLLVAAALVMAFGPACRTGDGTTVDHRLPGDLAGRASRELKVDRDAVQLGGVRGPLASNDGRWIWAAEAFTDGGAKTVLWWTDKGKPIDDATGRAALRRAGGPGSERIGPALKEALENDTLPERVRLAMWMDTPGLSGRIDAARVALLRRVDPNTRPRDGQVAEFLQQSVALVRDEVDAAVRPGLRKLEAMGVKIAGRSDLAPLCFVDASRGQVQELVDSGLALEIELDWFPIVLTQCTDVQAPITLEGACSFMQADRVWPGASGTAPTGSPGLDGDGVRVAGVEPGRPTLLNANLPIEDTRLGDVGVSDHYTATLGAVGSRMPGCRGSAPNASLFAANMERFDDWYGQILLSTQGFQEAVTWAVEDVPAGILTMSFGARVPQAHVDIRDRYVDFVARGTGRLIVISAGNCGTSDYCAGVEGAGGGPGNAFNCLSVGAVSLGLGLPGTESIAEFSSWVDPITLHAIPQIVAPGVKIMSMSSPPSEGGPAEFPMGPPQCGTSLAAPLVAGSVALIAEASPWLGTVQELSRAVMLATAWRSVDGETVEGDPSAGVPAVGEKEGAGCVDALAATRVARDGRYSLHYLYPGLFTNGTPYEADTFPADRNERVRVALAWSSTVDVDPTGHQLSDWLGADLDLHVSLNGTVIASSSGSFSSFEVLDFVAPADGDYAVRIGSSRFETVVEVAGVAISRESDTQ